MRLLSILLLLFLFACQQPEPSTTATSFQVVHDTVYIEKTQPDTFFPNGYEDISQFEEDGLVGIKFHDAKGLVNLLGHNAVLTHDTMVELDMKGLPRIHIINKPKTQLATLYYHYGNSYNDVSLIAVRYLNGKKDFPLEPERVAIEQFVSSKGIHLGMSLSEVKAILGEPSEYGRQAMLYYIAYQQKGGLYYGNYYFENGKLVFFEFGEEYP